MRRVTLSTELNIAFFIALFVPMVVATAYSIVYYGDKIKEEALNKVASDLKVAALIYDNKIKEMENLAKSYAQEKALAVLFPLGLNEKLGNHLAKSATQNGLDMVIGVGPDRKVVSRSHNPSHFGDTLPENAFIEAALLGHDVASTESLPVEELELEGLPENIIKNADGNFLLLTGASPVYDRNQNNVIGVIIVRRILNNDKTIVSEVKKNVDADSAIFEADRVIATSIGATTDKDHQVQSLKPAIRKMVLEEGKPFEEAIIKDDGYLAKYEPLLDLNDKPIGALMVRADAERYVETRFIAFASLLIIALVGFFLAYSIKIVIERRILTPIKTLQKGTEVIANGEYSHQLEVVSQNELGDLAVSFNTMALELKDTYAKLEEYNRELEQKVEERTAELTNTNRQMAETNQLLGETLETLNPGVSTLISKNKQHLGLIVATEFITDLVGYTRLNMTIGEKLTGEFITQFFRESHKLLAKYFAFRDKTIGDQIVATFGIPKDESPASPFHPFDSIFCAWQMKAAVELINERLHKTIIENYSTLQNRLMSLSAEDRESIDLEKIRFQIRIGINTSNPSTGREIDQMRMVMMGAETGVDYTGQGGALIYSSRLESSGTPGEIHIGENTKRYVEHVFALEELPTVQLKGLGVQSRYRVIGPKNFFANLYPKTLFYQKYQDHEPEMLGWALAHLNMGTIHIHEVRKIEAETEVSIQYMEHCAGVYQLSYAQAFFSYAIADELQLSATAKNSIIFASLWQNQRAPQMYCFEFKEADLASQLPDNIDLSQVSSILETLDKRSEGPLEEDPLESKIVDLGRRFDLMSFDRTYLRTRQNDIKSPVESIAILRRKELYPEEIIDALEKLMGPFTEKETSTSKAFASALRLPTDEKELIHFFDHNLNDTQKSILLKHLKS